MFNQVNITIKQSYAMLGILTLPSIVALTMLLIAEASLFSAGAACIVIDQRTSSLAALHPICQPG